MSDLVSPLWGAGYGSKRHLVAGQPVTHTVHGWRTARARCGLLLRAFADQPADAGDVAARPACGSCARAADRGGVA